MPGLPDTGATRPVIGMQAFLLFTLIEAMRKYTKKSSELATSGGLNFHQARSFCKLRTVKHGILQARGPKERQSATSARKVVSWR